LTCPSGNRLLAVTSLGLATVGTNPQTTVILNTRPVRRYRIEYTDTLGPETTWSPCAEDVTATGTWFSTNILSVPTESNRFFRIRQL